MMPRLSTQKTPTCTTIGRRRREPLWPPASGHSNNDNDGDNNPAQNVYNIQHTMITATLANTKHIQ